MDTRPPEIFNIEDFLKRMMEDRELAKAILDDFIAELPAKMETLEKHIRNGNAREAAVIAHLIKGEAASIGAEIMNGTAYAMERAAKSENMDELLRNMPCLQENAVSLIKTIEKTFT